MALPVTIAELRATGFPDRRVKEELRANLLERLGSGVALFPQVVGFEDSVLPVLERGLLGRARVLFDAHRTSATFDIHRMIPGP